LESEAKLFVVVNAGGLLGFFLGPREGGQEHAGEDCDNGDDDEEFDERERSAARWLEIRTHADGIARLMRSIGKSNL
jgi:hypothetical protein